MPISRNDIERIFSVGDVVESGGRRSRFQITFIGDDLVRIQPTQSPTKSRLRYDKLAVVIDSFSSVNEHKIEASVGELLAAHDLRDTQNESYLYGFAREYLSRKKSRIQTAPKLLRTYKEVIPSNTTAVALYTDGVHLNIVAGGVSESGLWNFADKRAFSKVIIFLKTATGGDIYLGDFKQKLKRPTTGDKQFVQFTNAKQVGKTIALWTEFTCQLNGRSQRVYLPRPDSVWTDPSEEGNYSEGARTTVVVNKYERDPKARQKCIDHFGAQCCVCKLKFENLYGSDLGSGFIHVHHLTPLASIGKTYTVDPLKDLVPVCPNCHAMIHRGNLTPEELRCLLKTLPIN